ncbi:MAG: LysR family transcriptional regulator [Burkholderiales bacterium]|nr:LysR family transcriptional regulator [Burkholderiales bacterium]
MIRFDDLQVFVSAADCGSLSAAARELDLTPAVASAALKRLEKELGTLLLVRSTRSLRLTVDGERYLVHARSSLAALTAGRDVLAADKAAITGNLTVSLPSDLGRHVLLPWLDVFQTQHPALALQLRVSDRIADLYRQPVDVALRYGVPADSGLVALPLVADNRRVLCASPAYLAQHGEPATPTDLRRHNCLRLVLGDQIHSRWSFLREAETHVVTVSGRHTSDDGEVVRRWAVAGQGIAYKSRLDVLADLRAGHLLPLLPAYQTEATPLYLVCPHRLSLSPAVIRLRDFLMQQLQAYLGPNPTVAG